MAWTKLIRMVNKQPWHINNFIFTLFSVVRDKLSNFVTNNHHFTKCVDSLVSFKEMDGSNALKTPKGYMDAALGGAAWLIWFHNFKHDDFDGNIRWRETRPKYLKTLNWRHFLMRIRANHDNGLLLYQELLPRQFQAIACIGRDLETKDFGWLWFEAERRLASIIRLWTTAPRPKGRSFHCINMRVEIWIHCSYSKEGKVWEMPGNASTSTAPPIIHAAKVLGWISWDQGGYSWWASKPKEPSLWNNTEPKWCNWAVPCVNRAKYDQKLDKVILQHYSLILPNLIKNFEMLEREVLPHLPYPLDIVSSNYYLFC